MKRTGNKQRKNAALLLLLLAFAFGAPVLLGTYLLKAASAPAPLPLPGPDSPVDLTAAGSAQSGSAARSAGSPLVSGTLYTNGPVKVNWSGVQIPVDNSTYAYSGGELISTAPNAMGILKLDSGSVVFICPNSRIRVSRNASGETQVQVEAGGGRFMFEESDAFLVKVNNTILSAAPDGSGETLTRHAYTGESVATEDGGCVLCNLSKNLKVGVELGSTRRGVLAKGGQIISVSGGNGANPISSLDLPGNVLAGMRAAMVSNGATGLGYLCKCRELKDYAERVGDRFAAQPGLALAQNENPDGPTSDASPGLPQLPDSQPAVAPPPVPDVTVAEGGEPDPFVPGLLPAAGEQQLEGDSDVVVPPPLVPGSGTGGGGTVSSS